MLSNLEKQPHHKWKNEFSPQVHTVSKQGSWTLNVFSKWLALQPLFQSCGSFGNIYPTNRDFPLGKENHGGTKSRPHFLWWKSSCALWSVPPVDSGQELLSELRLWWSLKITFSCVMCQWSTWLGYFFKDSKKTKRWYSVLRNLWFFTSENSDYRIAIRRATNFRNPLFFKCLLPSNHFLSNPS